MNSKNSKDSLVKRISSALIKYFIAFLLLLIVGGVVYYVISLDNMIINVVVSVVLLIGVITYKVREHFKRNY